VDYGERGAVLEWNGDVFDGDVAFGGEQLGAGEGRAHLEKSEAGGFGGVFAGLEKKSPDSLSRPIGMNKEGADFGGVVVRIKKIVHAMSPAIAAEERFAFAPAAAADYAGRGSSGGRRALELCNQVSAVGDELAVDPEDGFQRAINLFESVVVDLQTADRSFNKDAHFGDVGGSGGADVELRGHGKAPVRR
jgi:hypothetical protein